MARTFEISQRAVIEPLIKVLRRPEELPEVDEFRVAAYNMHNLFGNYSKHPASEEQLKSLGEMILSLDADAIAFEEVQNEIVLSSLFRNHVNPKLDDDSRYTSFVYVPGNDRRGINVALATRLSVRGALTFHDREFGPETADPVKFSRDLLGVEINTSPTYKFLFFVSHLKSQIGGERAENKRRLEAEEINKIFSEPAFGGCPFLGQDTLLAGDLNDQPDSKAVGALVAAGLSDILESVEPNYTYPTSGRKYEPQRLDYIFASKNMAKRIREPEIHREGPAATASDHFPVSATVRIVG